MRIVCHFPPHKDCRPWLEALHGQTRFPALVEAWQPGSPPADYAVVWKPSQAFFDAQPCLRAIFVAGAGVDGVLSLKLPIGVPLLRLEDAGMAAQMTEYVVHAVLRHFREFDTYAGQAAAGCWRERPLRKRSDFPVGLLGYGVLGQAAARALRALDFDVHAWTRTPRTSADLRIYSGADGLAAFLRATRILVCMLPLTAETQGIICRDTLDQLQSGSYLINLARGAHVVESDLIGALETGQLLGATLDVCRDEPAAPGHPFWRHPKIALTPHIAGTTLCAEAVEQIVNNIDALERGLPTHGRVDPRRGY